METLRLPYRPKPATMALAGLFFAGCGVVLFHTARTNDRGLILNRVIELGTGGATIFYWLLTACCVGFVFFAGLGLARAFGASGEAVLDQKALSAPRSGISGTIVTVPLATITDLRFKEINRQWFLVVHHAGGKLNIAASMLPSKDDLILLAGEIEHRRSTAAHRSQGTAGPTRDPLVRPPGGFGRRVR